MNTTLSLLKALADETRLRIINLLNTREFCVCEIEEVLNMSEPRISRHLKILKKSGIVKCRRDSKWCYYKIVSNNYIKSIIRLLLQKIKNDELFIKDIKKSKNIKSVCRI